MSHLPPSDETLEIYDAVYVFDGTWDGKLWANITVGNETRWAEFDCAVTLDNWREEIRAAVKRCAEDMDGIVKIIQRNPALDLH